MLIEVKVPAMTIVEIAMLNEDLNQVVYNHTGVMGESKLSDKKELESQIAEKDRENKELRELRNDFSELIDELIKVNGLTIYTNKMKSKINQSLNKQKTN